MYVCMYVCMYAYMCVCVYIHIYIYIYDTRMALHQIMTILQPIIIYYHWLADIHTQIVFGPRQGTRDPHSGFGGFGFSLRHA